MTQVGNPFGFYTDHDGSALQNGYIYIGQPDADPENYPLLAYWDAAFTSPAANIRTSNGYAINSGSLARIYVDAERYSIRVRNSLGEQVFYAASVEGDPFTSTDLSIGLFAALAAAPPRVPAIVQTVRTTGYSSLSVGRATYAYDAAVNAAFVAANPRTAFLALDGRGFRLVSDQLITPYQFGAAATEGVDNAAALQAFYDYCEDYNVRANQTGTFWLTAGTGIILNRETAASQVNTGTSTVDGVIALIVSANIVGSVVENTSKVGTLYGGFIIKPDTHEDVFASLVYADKKFDFGFNSEGYGFQQTVDFIQVFYARQIGVNVGGNLPATNTYASTFCQVYTYGCGSGVEWDVTELSLAVMEQRHLKSAYASLTAGGADAPAVSSYTQTTTIGGIAVFPPTNVEGVIVIRLGDQMLPVKRNADGTPMLDRTAGTATVYGRFAPGTAATGTLYWIFGGGFRGHGGDSATLDGKIVATGGAIGIQNTALYPGILIGIVQFNAVGYMVGTDVTGASVGGSFQGYWERNSVDVWTLFSPLSTYSHVIISEQALRINKMRQNVIPRDAAGVEYPHIMRPRGLVLEYRGARITNENPVENDDGTNCTISFDRSLSQEVELQGTNLSITVNPYIDSDSGEILDSDHWRIAGFRARKVICRGGTSGAVAPASITVTPHATRKLNGGALGASLAVAPDAGKATTVLVSRDLADPVNYLVCKA